VEAIMKEPFEEENDEEAGAEVDIDDEAEASLIREKDEETQEE
jgi:hypothetical protein